MKKISMIVPCYNEEENIELFYNKVKEIYKGSKKYKIELLFIDDGSTDQTLDKLKKLTKEKDFQIKVLSFSRNFGKESAIFAGLENSTGDYTLIIDVDLQQDPALTVKMAEVLDNEYYYDCVCYYQEERKEDKKIALIKKEFYKLMNKVSEVELRQGASDFRMFRKNVKESILELKESLRFTKGIFSWVGFNTYYIPYTPEVRKNGTSKWSFIKLFKYGISGIMSFSITPLRFSTLLGLIISFLSFFYLLVVIIQKLFFGISVPGYPTIVTLILFIGGIQLLCIGMLGEYIGKVYMESKKRPIYILKESVTNDKENKKNI